MARLLQIWNERNPRYTTLNEFLADIWADDELDRLNGFLLALGGKSCSQVGVYRLFLDLLQLSWRTNPYVKNFGLAMREKGKFLMLMEKSREDEPSSGQPGELAEQMLTWLNLRILPDFRWGIIIH